MNSRARRHPRYEAPRLRDEEAFRRYSQMYCGQEPGENAEKVAQMIARKHCAGRRGNLNGSDVLRAFRAGPEKNDDGAKAIMWMLGTISIPECTKLVVRCGVRYEEIARFVRAKEQKRDDLVRYLNQFTVAQRIPTP